MILGLWSLRVEPDRRARATLGIPHGLAHIHVFNLLAVHAGAHDGTFSLSFLNHRGGSLFRLPIHLAAGTAGLSFIGDPRNDARTGRSWAHPAGGLLFSLCSPRASSLSRSIRSSRG